jgi:hypothetical protein
METVWIQNLKAFITHGLFRNDERWMNIFVERLDALEEELQRNADLLRTATAFIEEMMAFGYGETSEKALPRSYDAFAEAVERVKG